MSQPLSRLKTSIFACISILIGLITVLGGLEIIMRFLPVNAVYSALPVNAENPLIHYPPNSTQQYSVGWNFSIAEKKHANNDGFYSDYDYVQSNKPIMAVIGDSFIQAAQIPAKDTVQERLQQELAGYGRVYGFGIQGAPLSQYLMFAEHAQREYQAQAMVFTIIANDFDQSILQYGQAAFGGMFVFSDTNPQAKLQLLPYEGSERSGLRGLLKQSALLRYIYDNLGFNPKQIQAWLANAKQTPVRFGGVDAVVEPQRFTDSLRAIDLFFQYLPEKSGLPVNKILFVMDGMREVKNAADDAPAQQSYFGQMRQYFMQTAQQRGYEVVDMHPIFLQAQQVGQKVDFIPQDWHWNSFAHKLVADAVKQTQVYQQTFQNQ